MYTNVQTFSFGSSPAPAQESRGPSIQANVGGVTTYNVEAPQEQPIVRPSAIQANVGGVLTIGSDGSSRSSGVQTFSVSEFATDSANSNFLATARNSGSPAMGNLKPDTVVKFQGMEVDLATLEAMGEVRRTATGYELPGASGGNNDNQPPRNQQEVAEPDLPDGVELFSNEVEASVAKAIGPFPQGIYDTTIARALTGGLDGINWNDVGYLSGMTPNEARDRAGVVIQAFSQQADNIAKTSGIDNPADVWDWAMTERKEQFMDAKRHLALGRNTAPLRALVKDYFTSEAPSAAALQQAGIPVRKDHNGETVAFIRGSWMTPAAAAKAGLI